jgi:hypothetical protein
MTLSIMTFSIKTLSIMVFSVTLRIYETQRSDTRQNGLICDTQKMTLRITITQFQVPLC